MKRIFSLAAALLLTVLLVLPIPTEAKGNAVSEARNGVVRILSIYYRDGSYATGSGLAVGEAGTASSIFVTNHHVIDDADDIYILLDNDWDTSIPAFGGIEDGVHAVKCEVVYTPSISPDYAILKTERLVTERVALPLMPAQLAVPGEQIFALGYPGVADYITQEESADINSISVTSGTISRFVHIESENTDAIQIDADINHGNSGGPLVTEEGYVIGLNTMYISDGDTAKISLSIEIDYVIDKLNNLIQSGKLPGFTFTVIDDPDAGDSGSGASAESSAAPAASADTESKQQDTKKDGFSPVILIVALVAVAAVVAVVLIIRKKKQPESKPVSDPEPAGYKPTVQVRQDIPNGGIPRIPSMPVQEPREIPNPVPPVVPARPEPQPPAPPMPQPPQPSRPVYFLICKDGHFAGKRFPVSKELRMGRQGGNEIAFPSDTPGVSGSHCVISPASNGVYLTDLGSTYGTVLSNGTKLTPNQKYLLKAGESFCVGTVNQKFMLAGGTDKVPGAVQAHAPAPAASAPAAPAGKSAFTLVGQTGVHAGRRYPISKELRLGRGSANDVSFPEGTPGISGSHCMLIPRGSAVYVVDLGSTYGTYLSNGTKLPPNQKQPLSKGDSFYLGNNKQMFRIE